MSYPLKKRLRAYYRKRLLTSLVWFALCLAVWLGSIEAFYGPGETVWTELWENAPYLLGAACAVVAVGILVSFGYLIARLCALRTGRLLVCQLKNGKLPFFNFTDDIGGPSPGRFWRTPGKLRQKRNYWTRSAI